MAKLVKKTKKPLGGLSRSTGTSAVETSPLRPVQVLKTPPCSNGLWKIQQAGIRRSLGNID